MRKMYFVCVMFIVLFFAFHCDLAMAATTSGVDRSLLQNVVVEPLLGGNSWRQDHVLAQLPDKKGVKRQ